MIASVFKKKYENIFYLLFSHLLGLVYLKEMKAIYDKIVTLAMEIDKDRTRLDALMALRVKLVDRAMAGLAAISSAYFVIDCLFGGRSPFWMLIVFFLMAFFSIGFLFGNLKFDARGA